MGITLRRAWTMTSASVGALLAAAVLVPAAAQAVAVIGESDTAPEAFDTRPAVAPGSALRGAANSLSGAEVTYDRFGSPRMLIAYDGWLASGYSGDAVEVARQFLTENAAAFGLSAGEVDGLELVNDSQLTGSDAHAVLLRQRFGNLPVVGGGMVVVGVSGANVASAASTLTQSPGLSGTPALSPREAWQTAASGGEVELAPAELDSAGRSKGFDRFDAKPLNAEQQVRLAALPMPGATARRVYEVNVVDNGAVPVAFTAYVDSETGEVIRRVNRLDQLADEPRWKYFDNIPPLDPSDPPDSRVIGCFPQVFTGTVQAGCEVDERSTAAAAGEPPMPWDRRGLLPGNTTSGNNADTALSAASPLTPGPDRAFRPVSATRDYISPFANQWLASKCNTPGVIAGGTPTPLSGPVVNGDRQQRHQRGDHLAVRQPQPHARLVLQPRLHRGQLQHAGQQLR